MTKINEKVIILEINRYIHVYILVNRLCLARILEKCIYTGNGNFGPIRNPYKTLTKKCIYTGDGFSFGAKNKKCICTKVYIY